MKQYPDLIKDQKTFNSLIADLRKTPAVALDTEFHCEKRYWPDLFLIQLAADGVGPVAVDPLALETLSPLAELFADDSVVKILHSARNDLVILFNDIPEFKVRNLFDSQVAAAFLGYGEQISLVNLVHSVCGVRSRKKYSMSDWSARPLARGQLEYALDDVRYLVEVYNALAAQLKKKGRTKWFEGESEPLSDPSAYSISRERLFSKARSAGKVKKASFPLLWRLVNWREDTARDMNRPRFYVGRDHLLCRLAVLAPRKVESINSLRGLPGGFVDKYGEAVVAEVEKCLKSPPDDVPKIRLPRHDWGYAARKDILRIFLKMKSKSLDLSPALLLPRNSFESILENPPRNMNQFMEREDLTQWRKEALGTELVDLFTGKLALTLKKGNSLRFVKVK
ncbi:MAG: HRDC domain-containing protein [Candidatus Fermentibacteraceae bacterium]|nr:HRDC domain-containing protein [Candidatus Fermentibacteraceae bacterium]